MALLTEGTNSQTVTVATEIALATNGLNPDNVPTGTTVVIFGVVQCAAGTGGTTAAVKVRQGSTTAGTQVGATVTSPALTANSAQLVPFCVIDTAPPANGQYVCTLTFTGNTSSVVSSNIVVQLDAGFMND
jgi:hypothetical protein